MKVFQEISNSSCGKAFSNGKGKLFLPIKAEIRKKIKKGPGDYVHVILFPDDDPIHVPEELHLCLEDEPQAEKFFNSLIDGEKQNYIKWIYSTRKEETKVKRINEAINRLAQKRKFYDKI